LIEGLAKSGLYGTKASAGELTGEVSHELTALLDDIVAGLEARR
jgi:hypothetical protein